MSETDKPVPAGETTNATRGLRIAMIAAVVFGLFYRFADPTDVVADQARFATPYALGSLLIVFVLGGWAFEATGRGGVDPKADLIWGVVIAIVAYLGWTLAVAGGYLM